MSINPAIRYHGPNNGGFTAWLRAQSNGPPANTPKPVWKTFEYATPSWAEKNPPLERPDTETELGSILYAPKAAAEVVPAKLASPARVAQ
ncbi:hypothetical protein PENSUB_5674 [Penicillium subrubescens]|uniref:Uncharacterized protein n=1 Tax=Penicillium subrubescens TaxID=1316194 RepID=A0A1Q5U761_9EURO|nr:hypothetical protein PENSUB_5674 [Penicillium subrubescens]